MTKNMFDTIQVDVTENHKDDVEISDEDIFFFINLFPDGYSIGNPYVVCYKLQHHVRGVKNGMLVFKFMLYWPTLILGKNGFALKK